MADLVKAMTEAGQQLQAGNLHVAERIYQQILQADPQHLEVINLLAMVAHRLGKQAQAIAFMERAVGLRPPRRRPGCRPPDTPAQGWNESRQCPGCATACAALH